ncbi:MAG: response regulator [Thermoleophilaceae bacterium]
MTPERVTPIEILLVEDSESDIVLTQEVLKEAKVINSLAVARDGEEALRRVRKEGGHRDDPRPDLILLDLNLPRKDGREVLRELKEDRELRRIPVVVLTTSAEERDIVAAYDRHVNAYITKPVDIDQFVSVVRSIEDFWLSVVTLPDG